MNAEPRFVRPNVRIEGLIDSFVAWLHVAAPVTGAMNLANLHLPMLDSFVAQPEVHAAAVANPKMKGGFFLNVDVSRVEEVRRLRDAIARDNRATLDFAGAVKQADELLRAQATGYDLSPLYAQLPPALRGYVELVYDMGNNPQLRFMESLLYRSLHYRPERQSVELSIDDGSEPPFVLSTPRLPAPGHLRLDVPLAHPGIDRLFASRTRPVPLGELREALGVGDDAAAAGLDALLTADYAPPADRHVESGGRIRYFGHACLVMQSPTATIMVDPFVSSDTGAGDRFTYEDLPDRIDYALITHGHQDHVVLETLLQIRHKVGTVVVPRSGGGHRQDPSIRLLLEHFGFPVIEVDDFDELPFDGGSIVATPFLGEHCDLDIRAKSTYWVRIADRSVFVGADSSGLEAELYGDISKALGPADHAFIGMECDGAPLTWLYSPLFTCPVPRKMALTRKLSGSDAAQALDIVDRLQAGHAYVYAMGQEPWLQHIMATSYTPESYQLKQVAEFLKGCQARGVPAEHLLTRREVRW
ncbi:MBL fold metallo-hydrolase [Nonomuraea sediminis]|uniref:MBL fold metallo-hydrolase n=1 Tax=Nonomuraea sediminis TaxID=2835864 RepID=UPI001BDD82E5|nr:MBL fold metallo-hydrolase [Nonomuraea sediminis]